MERIDREKAPFLRFVIRKSKGDASGKHGEGGFLDGLTSGDLGAELWGIEGKDSRWFRSDSTPGICSSS